MSDDTAICIPTFNQAEYLPIAVRSAVAQNTEVWVGDDASTDDTAKVLETFDVRVIRREQNLGIAENTSDLLSRPTTEFVVRLDSDDVLEPTFVARLVALMRRHPEAGWGHTAVTAIDATGSPFQQRHLARSTGFQPAEAALRAGLSGYRTVANVVIFRRRALEELGFYRGRPEFVEDWDLSLRMADAGWGNVYIDEPLARYREWTTPARARRKALQLRGYRRIFDETITPAWERRGWALDEVTARRSGLAARHCASCFEDHFTAEERRELTELLLGLSDTPRVRVRLALCRAGLGPQIGALQRVMPLVKAGVKRVLRAARRA